MANKANVVRIEDGSELHAIPGESVQTLVDHLENLLQLAKTGKICGIVGAVVYPGKEGYLRSSSDTWAGIIDSYSAIGALEVAKLAMVDRMKD